MKLITFQSFEALKSLIDNKYLVCNEKYIDKKKLETTYKWVIEKMSEQVANDINAKYPIWCWVKCYNGICPPKRKKAKKVNGFDVKITFNKNKKDVFITDFRRYSFLLNNVYIPKSIEDKNKFNNELLKNNITMEDLKAYVRHDKYEFNRQDKAFLDICKKIRKSFDRCITEDSDILQGCVWDIKLEDIDKIEFLNLKDDYSYGTINYIRANNKRIDWIEDFYKLLK